tara:strand:- start:1819 stop:2370 length:552 start_codon:yes stop_codon:yes gene_type:complete
VIHKYNIYYFIDKFDRDEINNLNKKISIIYRNYKIIENKKELKKLSCFCKSNQRKIFFANNLKLAIKYNFDGLYIPSFNKNLRYKNLNFKRHFELIGSAHNVVEVKIKENQGCKIIFISPIFKNQNYKNYLGTTKFNYLTNDTKSKVIALGGINQSNIKLLGLTKSLGFASINWIKKNRPTFK